MHHQAPPAKVNRLLSSSWVSIPLPLRGEYAQKWQKCKYGATYRGYLLMIWWQSLNFKATLGVNLFNNNNWEAGPNHLSQNWTGSSVEAIYHYLMALRRSASGMEDLLWSKDVPWYIFPANISNNIFFQTFAETKHFKKCVKLRKNQSSDNPMKHSAPMMNIMFYSKILLDTYCKNNLTWHYVLCRNFIYECISTVRAPLLSALKL